MRIHLAGIFLAILNSALFAQPADYESEPINYSRATPIDIVSRIQKRLDEGLWIPDATSEKALMVDLLEEFDLKERLFKNRCSFLIYSESFDALVGPLKEVVYLKLWEVLNGKENSELFDHLDEGERNA